MTESKQLEQLIQSLNETYRQMNGDGGRVERTQTPPATPAESVNLYFAPIAQDLPDAMVILTIRGVNNLTDAERVGRDMLADMGLTPNDWYLDDAESDGF